MPLRHVPGMVLCVMAPMRGPMREGTMSEAKPGEHPIAADHDDTAEFDTMMQALDAFFHMAVCPNHTPDERGLALKMAREAYIGFAYDGEDPEGPEVVGAAPAIIESEHQHEHVLGDDDPAQNAPTSNKVH
jgi:hypothetical protein